MREKVCASCSFIGKPIKQCYESFLVDAFIWGIVGSFALMTGILPALIIPTLWTLYHLAKFGSIKCPSCGDLEMVNKNSRKGRSTISGDNKATTVWARSESHPAAK